MRCSHKPKSACWHGASPYTLPTSIELDFVEVAEHGLAAPLGAAPWRQAIAGADLSHLVARDRAAILLQSVWNTMFT